MVITALVTLFTLGILLYIGYQIYRFQTPPKLNILQPSSDYTTEEETLLIKGSIEKGVVVEVNDVVTEVENFQILKKV